MSLLSAPKQTLDDRQTLGLTGPSTREQASCWEGNSLEPASTTAAAPSLPTRSARATGRFQSVVDGICRWIVRQHVESLSASKIELIDVADRGAPPQSQGPTLYVHDPRFYRRALVSGSLGVAESYLRGEWTTDDLVALMRMLARSLDGVGQIDQGVTRVVPRFRSVVNWLRRNTRSGSRRNIAAHYDLSNEFFSLMLDPTMTYSSGIFANSSVTMQQASLAKYERICRKLDLSPRDHLLEIGTGWGGFAIYAARNYGCRVTTTTISREQHDYAQDEIRRANLAGRVRLVRTDYRDLAGEYDKLVSIEMIEAVGRRFLNGYFQQCSRLLKPWGMMVLQAITIPDHRYDEYCRSVDFIQRYIFPGGCLPSFSAIGQSLRRSTDFRLFHSEEFGLHYAQTLSRWRRQFWQNIERVRELGFDDRFIRMWHYYLCYCEAGFHERQIGVSQLVLTKPACQRQPLLGAI